MKKHKLAPKKYKVGDEVKIIGTDGCYTSLDKVNKKSFFKDDEMRSRAGASEWKKHGFTPQQGMTGKVVHSFVKSSGAERTRVHILLIDDEYYVPTSEYWLAPLIEPEPPKPHFHELRDLREVEGEIDEKLAAELFVKIYDLEDDPVKSAEIQLTFQHTFEIDGSTQSIQSTTSYFEFDPDLISRYSHRHFFAVQPSLRTFIRDAIARAKKRIEQKFDISLPDSSSGFPSEINTSVALRLWKTLSLDFV